VSREASAGPVDPLTRHPIAGWKGTAFLRAIVDEPNIEIGDYSYYDDSRGPEHFVARCVRYHFPFVGDRLIIGRFVAIAQGVQFVMNGANHAMDGLFYLSLLHAGLRARRGSGRGERNVQGRHDRRQRRLDRP
jgi:hypothetical protein